MVALARLLRLYLNQEERAAGRSAPLRPSGLRGARPGAARRVLRARGELGHRFQRTTGSELVWPATKQRIFCLANT